MPGAGASSITFWWRRCKEHSRSKQMHGVRVPVAEDLHFDMARAGDVFLDQHMRSLPKAGLRLALRAFERGLEIGVLVDAAHALAAAARDRLDENRIADLT
jgi:hypothetical protein